MKFGKRVSTRGAVVAMATAITVSFAVTDQARAGAIAVIDQQNASNIFNAFAPNFTGVGQSFTPTLTEIDAADFVFTATNASLELTLYSGSGIGGSALATSASVPLTSGFFNFQTVLFSLPSTTLIPGDTYTLFVTAVTGKFGFEDTGGNNYAGGEFFNQSGIASPTTDLIFAEGLAAIPEPSTWALLVLGFAGLAFAGYHRTRSRTALAA